MYVIPCVFIGHIYMGDQKRELDLLKLELQEVVSCPTQVRTKCGSSEE